MKINQKLISVMLALSISMSLFVFSTVTEAAKVNVLEGKTVLYNDNTTEVPAEDGIYTVTGAKAAAGHYDTWIRINSLQLDGNSTYKVSAYVKNGDESIDTGWAAWFADFRGADATIPETRTTVAAGGNADEWRLVSAVVTTKDTGNSKAVIHLAMRLYGSTTEEKILVKDFEMYKVTAFTAEASGIVSGATDVPVNTSVSYTFSNDLSAELTADNFILTGGTGTVTVVNDSSASCTVSLSGLAYGTDYSLSLNGVDDFLGQTVESTISFRTVEASGLGMTNLFDYTKMVMADNATPITPVDGVFTLSGYTENTSPLRQNGFSVKANTTYYVAAKARLKNPMVEGQAPTQVKITSFRTVPSNNQNVTTLSNEWKTISNTVTVGESNETEHFGITVRFGTADVEVKDLVLYELKKCSLDNTYSAGAIRTGENVTVYMPLAKDKTVYVISALYDENGNITDIKFDKATGDGTGSNDAVQELSVYAGEGYTLFIWDSNLKPLHKAVSVSSI